MHAIVRFSNIVQGATFSYSYVAISIVKYVYSFVTKGTLCGFSVRPSRRVATYLNLIELFRPYRVVPILGNDHSQVNHMVGSGSAGLFGYGPQAKVFVSQGRFRIWFQSLIGMFFVYGVPTTIERHLLHPFLLRFVCSSGGRSRRGCNGRGRWGTRLRLFFSYSSFFVSLSVN